MWNNPRIMNMIALILCAFAAFALLAVGVAKLARAKHFSIQRVVVVGALNEVDPKFIERIVRTEFAGTYFTLSLAKAQQALQRAPWVKTVAVRRIWPATLELRITEHNALARWNSDQLVSTDSIVFEGLTTAALPQLGGPTASERDVVGKFRIAQQELQKLGYEVRVMTLSPSYSLSVELDKGPSVHFGREQFEQRLNRFVAHVGQIREQITVPIDSFDLRYGKGVAVAMTTEGLMPSSKKQDGLKR